MFHLRKIDAVLKNENRISSKAIEEAVSLAKSRWPDAQIYFLSDKHNTPAGCALAAEGNFQNKIVVTAFENDQNADEMHSQITQQGGTFITPKQYEPPAHYLDKNLVGKEVLQTEFIKAQELGLTHFEPEDFSNIFQCLEVTRELDGAYVEIGVFKGDGARSVLSYLNKANLRRNVILMDTYEGFNYEAAKKSVDAQWLGTHADTSLESVKQKLAPYIGNLDVQWVQADICVHTFNSADKIAVCNIDVDMYEAVKYALEKTADLVVKRGIIIAEDVGHTPGLGGASLAVREFLNTEKGKKFIPYYIRSGQCLLFKVEM